MDKRPSFEATAAQRELEALRRRDPDRDSYGGLRDEMATAPLVTFESVEPRAIEASVAKWLIAMTFMSQHDNARPHIVTKHFDGTLTCTCQATAPCWGIKAFRTVTGQV